MRVNSSLFAFWHNTQDPVDITRNVDIAQFDATNGRAETPRMMPTPMPLAIPVKRLLRTQGISLIREKSENDSLFVASRTSVHVSPEVSMFPTYTGFFGAVDFGVEGVSIE